MATADEASIRLHLIRAILSALRRRRSYNLIHLEYPKVSKEELHKRVKAVERAKYAAM